MDRSRDPPIHNWHDIVFYGMQSLGPMGSSLTHTLKALSLPTWAMGRMCQIGHLLHVVLWPHGQQPHPHTIKKHLPPMGSREEHVIQSERTLIWI